MLILKKIKMFLLAGILSALFMTNCTSPDVAESIKTVSESGVQTSVVTIEIENAGEYPNAAFDFEAKLNNKLVIIPITSSPKFNISISYGSFDVKVIVLKDGDEVATVSGIFDINKPKMTVSLKITKETPTTCSPVTFETGEGTYSQNSPPKVILSTLTAGASIYFTINGEDPDSDSEEYVDGIDLYIANTFVIKAIAIHNTLLPSKVTTGTYIITDKDVVSPISVSPKAGTYTFSTFSGVTLTVETEGAKIYYTVDGTEPTNKSTLYSGTAITLAEGTHTIKAIALKDGFEASSVLNAKYILAGNSNNQVATPVISAKTSAPYKANTLFSITCTTVGAEIRYTTNNDEPTIASKKYDGEFTLPVGNITVKAIAVNGSIVSDVAQSSFTIVSDGPQTLTAPIIVVSGSMPYNVNSEVSITSAGSNIYYTTNGDEPTAASQKYSAAFKLGVGSHTIKAFATKADMLDSSVSSKTITIEALYDGVVIYYYGTSAPKIWTWEANDGKKISELMGFTWASRPAMTEVAGLTKWFKFEIPSTYLTGKDINVKFEETETLRVGGKTGWYKDSKWTDENPDKPKLPVVTCSPSAGAFDTSTSVTLTVTPYSAIYYTVDGSTPTTSSNVYGSAIALTATTTIKTMVTDGSVEDVKTFVFTKNGPQAPVVSANPGSKYFETSVSVTLTSTPAVTIYYTVDGSMPTASSTAYSTALTFNDTTTLKTFVKKDGISDVKTFTYTKGAVSSYYATNPNGQVGKSKTVAALSDWSEDMVVAQGAANDCARSWLGFHEYPDPDLYALFAAWDSTNLYLMVEMPNIDGADTIDNDKSYAGSQFLPMGWAINTGKGTAGNGLMADGFNVWTKAKVYTFADGIDTLIMHHPRLGIGKPSIFKTDSAGKFGYEPAQVQGFTEAGVLRLPSFNQSVSTSMWAGVTATGDLGGKDSVDVTTYDYVDLKLDGKKATSYQITIPLASLGIDKGYLESTGISVAVFSTYGESMMDILPWDPSMIDNAKTPYSKDPSSSAEKEDFDEITASLARVGKL